MIEIYYLKTDNKIGENIFKKFLSKVEEKKQDRIKKFHKYEDSIRVLFADLLIRHIIIERSNSKNDDLMFSTNAYGKPLLTNSQDFHFNISHSGIWIVCIIDNNTVGIDIEEIRPIDLDISKKIFSKEENSDLLNSENKLDKFYKLWTLKESYIKKIGKGLNIPLNSYSIRKNDNHKICIESEGRKIHNIYFKEYNIDKQYKMAACASNNLFPQKIIPVSLDTVLGSF